MVRDDNTNPEVGVAPSAQDLDGVRGMSLVKDTLPPQGASPSVFHRQNVCLGDT